MSQDFDPYHKWLGISPKDQPPHHYRLLGIDAFESDPDVISDAAEQRMAHVRGYQLGKHVDLSQNILNEIAAARVCLLNPRKKAEYDGQLRAALATASPAACTAKPSPVAASCPSATSDCEAVGLQLASRKALQRKIPWIMAAGTVFVAAAAWFISSIRSEHDGSLPETVQEAPIASERPQNAVQEIAPAQTAVAQSSEVTPNTQQSLPAGFSRDRRAEPESEPVQMRLSVSEDAREEHPLSYFKGIRQDANLSMWLVAGPFLYDSLDEAYQDVHPIEREAICVDQQFKTSAGTIVWKPVEAVQGEKDSKNIDVARATSATLPATRFGVYYAVCWIRLPPCSTESDRFVANCPFKLWINRKERLDSAEDKAYRASGRLFPWNGRGWQELLVKVVVAKGRRAPALFSASTVARKDASGRVVLVPLPQITLEPPVESIPAINAKQTQRRSGTSEGPSDPANGVKVSKDGKRSIPPVAKRHAIPAPDIQKQFLEQVEEVYKPATLDKATEKLELAKQLLAMGQKADGDPQERYVLLSKSMDLACAAGDSELMLLAADAIGRDFDIDRLDLKTQMLMRLLREGVHPAGADLLVAACRKTVDEAITAGKFDTAQKIVDLASRIVQGKANVKLRKSVQLSRQKVQQCRDLWTQFEEAQTTIETEPSDEDANLCVGKWHWLAKDDWPVAATFLAKGSDSKLRELAERELAAKRLTREEIIAAGDTWWALASSRKGYEKDAMMLRAAHCYREAVGDLASGLIKTRIEKRLGELAALEAAARGEPTEPPGAPPGNSTSRSGRSKDMPRLPGKVLPEKIDGKVELSKAGGPYKLMGTILVAKGGTLAMERGAKVLCAAAAKIAVDGQIVSYGDGEQFVSFRPAVAGCPWGGISIPRGDKRACVLERFDIRGAETGFDIGCSFEMKDSILVQNATGIRIEERDKHTINNCVIANNLKDGIVLHIAPIDVAHCTIANNGGVGLLMAYYGTATVKASVLSGNAVGAQSKLYETVLELHSSNITRNRVAIEIQTKQQFQCANNYWGTSDARQIPQMVMDGRTKPDVGIVDFNPFEKKPIADAGCSLHVPKF